MRLAWLVMLARAKPEVKLLAARATAEVLRVRFALLARAFNSIALGPPYRSQGQTTAHQVIRAVRVIAKFVPTASCLTQATAAHCLLHRYGYSSIILIGVRKDDHKGFQAHAWLMHQGQCVLGGEELVGNNYNVLQSIDLSAKK
jgi:hypothetical protein